MEHATTHIDGAPSANEDVRARVKPNREVRLISISWRKVLRAEKHAAGDSSERNHPAVGAREVPARSERLESPGVVRSQHPKDFDGNDIEIPFQATAQTAIPVLMR